MVTFLTVKKLAMVCKLTLHMKVKHLDSDESAPYLEIEQKQPFEYNHNQLRPIVHFSGGVVRNTSS